MGILGSCGKVVGLWMAVRAVGTVKCEGEPIYLADFSQDESTMNPKISGNVGTTRKVWGAVGNKDVSGRLLVATVPVVKLKSERVVKKCAKKEENLSPNIK